MDAGADANTGWFDNTGQPKPHWESAIYGAAGIAEYWIVNIPGRLLEVHRDPRPDGYGLVQRYEANATVRPLFAEEANVRVRII